MTDPRPADIVVQPLRRSILDGVDDETGGPRRAVDLAVLPCFEDERPLQGLAGLVDWRTSGELSALLRSGFCTGATGEAVLVPGHRTVPMSRMVMFGLGPSSAFDRRAAQDAAKRLVELVDRMAPRDVLVAMPGRVPDRAVVEALFEALARALHRPEPESVARPAARAVGDESGGVVVLDPIDRGPPPPPERPRPALAVDPAVDAVAERPPEPKRPPQPERAPEPDVRSPAPLAPRSDGGSPEPDAVPEPPRALTPAAEPIPAVCRWWVVADPRHEARLRRLLEGPPRAAEPGA